MDKEIDRGEYLKHRENRNRGDEYFPAGTEHEDEVVFMNGHYYAWDKAKNEANKLVHGIDFYTAIYVFNDEDRLEDENSFVQGELREQAIGEPTGPVLDEHPIDTKHSRPKAILGQVEGVLFIVFTEEAIQAGEATRIISARAADEEEAAAYFEWKFNV